MEIGFGSGVTLESVRSRFSRVVGTDIIPLKEARIARGGAELILADAASCFRPGSFDLIWFNPPYLPSDGIEDRAVDGGAGGIEVPTHFLDEALRVLREDGRILVLLSEEGDIGRFRNLCLDRGLSVQEKSRRKLFYETLVVYEIRRRRPASGERQISC